MAQRWSTWYKNNGGSATSSGTSTSNYRKKKKEEEQGVQSFDEWHEQNPDAGEKYRQRAQQREYQQSARNEDRQKVVSGITNWSRAVRESDGSNVAELARQAQQYTDYFSRNRDKYDEKTLNTVSSILKNGQNMLRQNRARIDNANFAQQAEQNYQQAYQGMRDEMNGADRVAYINALRKRQADLAAERFDTAPEEQYEQRKDVESVLEDLRSQNKELRRLRSIRDYAQNTQASDYDQLSRYRSTANGKKQEYGFGGAMTETGFNDYLYDYINKNPAAILAQNVNTTYGDERAGTDKAELLQMTEQEVGIFNYLYSRNRKDAFDYVEAIRPELLQRQAQAETEQWSEFADQNPVLGSILSVPNNLVSSIDAMIGMGVASLSGEEIDPNAGYFRGRRTNNAIRQTVGENVGNAIAEENAKSQRGWEAVQALREGKPFEQVSNEILTDDRLEEIKQENFSHTLQKLGNTAYGSVMSQLDNMMNIALTGGAQGAALTLMSMTAMPDAIVSAKENGLSDKDAFSLGVIAGAAEYMTEKVSLDALFDMERIAKQGFMKYVATNAMTEGSEEVASDFINFVAQQMIAGENSDFNRTVKAYQQNGMSHEEAVKAAWADQVEQAAYSFIGGALAGGGAAVGFGAANQLNQGRVDRYGAQVRENLAEDDPLRNLTDPELGQMAIDQAQIEREDFVSRNNLEQAAQQMASNGAVNSVLTDAILNDENSRRMLQEETGAASISSEESMMDALRQYGQIQSERAAEQTRFLDDQGNVNPTAVDYVSNRAALSNAVSDNVISRTFGEEGAKIYRNISDRAIESGMSPQQAYQEISQVYNAGTNRQSISTRTNLPEADVNALFKAGYQDSLKYAERDNQNANFASATGAGVVENELIESLRSDPVMSKSIDNMGKVAQALGIRVTYVPHLDANGIFNEKTKEVQIAADADPDATMAWVFGHEMTHRLQQSAPVEYNTLKQAVQTALGSGRFNLEVQKELNKALRDGVDMTQQGAQDEAVANFVGELVRDRNALNDFIENNSKTKEGKSLLTKIRDFFRNLFRKLSGAYGETEITDNIQQTIDALTNAIEAGAKNVANYNINQLDQTNEVVTDNNGNPVAEFQEDGSVLLSLRSYEDNGRRIFQSYLDKMVKNGELSTQEADDMKNELETVYDICKKYADTGKYIPFNVWSSADVIYNSKGKPVFSSIKANSEYKMNIDFSTICKKRRTLDAVFREMISRGMLEELDLNKDESAAMVVNINDLIRKHGFEAACALCFVEARRYRQQQTATTFRDMWNGLVESMYKDKSKIAYFNFGRDNTVADVPEGIHTMDDKELNLKELQKLADAKNEKGKPLATAEAKAARLLLNDPSQRKLMRIGDMMASTGFENMQIENPELMKIYNSKKGTGGAKSSFGDVQYLNEIIQSQTFDRMKAYTVSGVRIQSFSDYVPRMVFDYVQVIADLAAKRLPAHAYTKEALFVKQFGLTGAKINMSLVPDVVKDGVAPGLDSKGNYIWNEEGTFPFKEAMEIQKAEGYKENCGTIAVGISDEQILKMLADPEIQMVIPYHKSSLNPIVAAMTNVDRFTDYTDYQNTKDAEGKTVKKDFDWDKKLFRLSHDKNGKLLPKSKWGNIQDLVKEYVEWCEKRNYTPKFSQFLYMKDGSINPGYYKMLEDFALLDNDGSFKPQGDVQMRFPTETDAFGSMASLIEQGLSEDTKLEAKMQKEINGIVDEIQRMIDRGTIAENKGLRFSRKEIEDIKAKKRTNAKDREILRDAGEKLSEKDFYKLYSVHKLDLRGKGNVNEQVESIKSNGFSGDAGFGINVVPASINNAERYTEAERRSYLKEAGLSDKDIDESIKYQRDNPGGGFWYGDVYFPRLTFPERKYGGMKGDTVLLVPEHYTEKGRKVLNGFKPFDYEVVNVEYDFQPYYELYSKAYDEAHEETRFSRKDSDYMAAVEAGDMETAQRMVDEAAVDAGYNSEDLYHGTPNFGFTSFDLDMMKDDISIFATNDRFVAQSYVGDSAKVRNISDAFIGDVNNMSVDELTNAYNGMFKEKIYALDQKQRNVATEKLRQELRNAEAIVNAIKNENQGWYDDAVEKEIDRMTAALEDMASAKDIDGVVDAHNEFIDARSKVYDKGGRVADKLMESRVAGIEMDAVDFLPVLLGNSKALYAFEAQKDSPSGFFTDREIKDAVNGLRGGIYKMRGRTDNMLEIDADWSNWNNIDLGDYAAEFNDWWINEEGHEPAMNGFYRKADTRSIAKFAKAKGYNGVAIYDVYDSGGFTEYNEMSDIYIYFNESDLKSTDPVTYDDDGNIIPLSERFNRNNNDIRYSRKDSEGRDLSEGQQKYFANSKVRDENGNLKVMYHGTGNFGFTIFDPNRSDDRRSLFFTDDPEVAASYSGADFSFSLDKKYSFEELSEIIESLSDGETYIEKSGSGYRLMEVGMIDQPDNVVLESNDLDKIRDYYVDNYLSYMFGESANYAVYLNLTNPLIIDAEYNNWNELEKLWDKEVKTGYFYMMLYNDLGFDSEEDDLDENTARYEVEYSGYDGEGTKTFSEAELKGMLTEDEWKNFILGREIEGIYLDEDGNRIPSDTRAYSRYAAENGYDGVIFKNLIDNGIYGSKNEVSTVAVAFTSNQVKSVDNINPTENPDIRRSRRSNETMSSLLEAAEANYRDERVRDAFMEAATQWRTNMTALSDFGKGGFNARMTDLVKTYRPDISEKESETIVREMRNLTREVARRPDIEYVEIADKANAIATRILWGKGGSMPKYDESAAQAVYDIRNDMMAQIIQTTTRGEGKYQKLSNEFSEYKERTKARNERRYKNLADEFAAYREKAQKNITEVRNKRDAQIKKLRENKKKASEGRKAREIRDKIMRHVSDLSNLLLKPTDQKHIPKSLQPTVAKLLEAINLESTYRDKNGNVMTGAATKRTVAFQELQAIYAEMAKGGHMVIDPDLMGDSLTTGLFAEVIAMRDTSIMAMNSAQLDKIWRVVRAVENAVRTANKLFAQSRYQNVSQVATVLHDDNEGKTKGNINLGKIQKLVALDMLTPEAYFHRLGDAGDYLFKEMRKAQDDAITIYNEAVQYGKENLEGADFRKLEKEMHQVTIGGRKINLSTAQLMELYLLMGREQAREHILNPSGGLKLRDVKKGAKIERHPDPIKNIKEQEIAATIALLSPQQIAWADAMQKYVAGPLADHGNEAAMKVYGYEKFTDDNYWKITSNEQDVRRDIGQTKGVITSVAGKGMAQPLTPKANTSIMLGSIFDTYSNSILEMADYAAWLATMEDVNRIRNFQAYEGEKGDRHRVWTMQQTFDRVFGDGGAKYLETLMSHLANGVNSEQTFFGGFTGNYKAAAIGFNIRVVIQQPTAIFRAMDMISPKYLIAGATANALKGWKEAKKYSPIAVWKDWGFFDVGTGRQMKGILFEDTNALEKIKAAGMWLPGQADSVGWGWLWNAVKKEVKATTDLTGEAFYKRVAERFNDVVDHTQVVDGVLQRSDIMRRSDALTKMAVSFMAEPMKQYNMMVSAVYDLRHAKGEKLKIAKQKVARCAGALLIAGILNAVAQSIVDGLRNTDRDKDYWEKFLAALLGDYDENKKSKFEVAIQSNLGDMLNVAGYIPFAKDILSLLEGYDVSRMDMDAISDSIKSAQGIVKASKGEGKDTLGMAIVNACGSFGQLLGISFKNIKREALAVASNTVHATGSYVAEYHLLAAQKNINSTTKKEYVDLLLEAYDNDRDAFNELYDIYIKDDRFATSSLTSKEYIDDKVNKHETEQNNERNRESAGLTQADMDRYEYALAAHDVDGSGTAQKDEIYQTLMEIDMTMKQKETLWAEKGYTKDKKPQTLAEYDAIMKKKK